VTLVALFCLWVLRWVRPTYAPCSRCALLEVRRAAARRAVVEVEGERDALRLFLLRHAPWWQAE
jgi:hypothetical protein